MKKTKDKDKIVSIRMKRKDFRLLEEDARKQQRSVSNLFVWLWTQWREKKR